VFASSPDAKSPTRAENNLELANGATWEPAPGVAGKGRSYRRGGVTGDNFGSPLDATPPCSYDEPMNLTPSPQKRAVPLFTLAVLLLVFLLALPLAASVARSFSAAAGDVVPTAEVSR
jgi:hypothetical protein